MTGTQFTLGGMSVESARRVTKLMVTVIFGSTFDLKEGGLSTSQLRAGLVASIDVVLARCGLTFSVGRLKPERELETKAALIFAQSQPANPA